MLIEMLMVGIDSGYQVLGGAGKQFWHAGEDIHGNPASCHHQRSVTLNQSVKHFTVGGCSGKRKNLVKSASYANDPS